MSATQAGYESVAYPHYVHPLTDPARLAALGRIFGVRAADPNAARVLEIGCGAGTNLLAMAARLPGSQFVGLDFAGPDIVLARALAAEAGLPNVEFQQQDLLTWQPDGARFDYIVAWGVFSWVPREVKDRLLAICQECLTPAGIACVSYMTYPGCKQAESLRDLLLMRTGSATEAPAKIAGAHRTLDFLDRAYAALPPTAVHAAFLRQEVGRIREKEGHLLLHDDLEVNRDPLYLLQFAGWAGQHGLRYLGDAEFHSMLLENLPAESARELSALGLSQLESEQMIDFVVNRSFRSTLLARADAADGALHPEALADLCFQGRLQPEGPWRPGDPEGIFLTATEKKVALRPVELVSFLRALAERPHAFTTFGEILQAAQTTVGRPFTEPERTRLCGRLLTLYGKKQVVISARPFHPMAQVAERPRLTPLNAALIRRRSILATALQELTQPGEHELACCALLDGTRDREQLQTATGRTAQEIETLLAGLQRAGCLAG